MVLQAVESEKTGSTYASLAAAPANYNAIHTVEVERYLSAALFGLASSAAGRDAIASAEAQVVRGKLDSCYASLPVGGISLPVTSNMSLHVSCNIEGGQSRGSMHHVQNPSLLLMTATTRMKLSATCKDFFEGADGCHFVACCRNGHLVLLA